VSSGHNIIFLPNSSAEYRIVKISVMIIRCLECFDGRKGIQPVKIGGWWTWALVSPD